MDFDSISPELMNKAKACTSPEELLTLAQEEGYELSDEQLEDIAGGGVWDSQCTNNACPMHRLGDERDDIDEACVPKAFMTGELRGDELD